ncbi:hypothetical protein M885DRAFT_625678 [Pelagophyceae sp. CCMP2097]|nr:hypothetical protein M885DRAFT_625678 [Pelagophyceae sp. CCMP2097]
MGFLVLCLAACLGPRRTGADVFRRSAVARAPPREKPSGVEVTGEGLPRGVVRSAAAEELRAAPSSWAARLPWAARQRRKRLDVVVSEAAGLYADQGYLVSSIRAKYDAQGVLRLEATPVRYADPAVAVLGGARTRGSTVARLLRLRRGQAFRLDETLWKDGMGLFFKSAKRRLVVGEDSTEARLELYDVVERSFVSVSPELQVDAGGGRFVLSAVDRNVLGRGLEAATDVECVFGARGATEVAWRLCNKPLCAARPRAGAEGALPWEATLRRGEKERRLGLRLGAPRFSDRRPGDVTRRVECDVAQIYDDGAPRLFQSRRLASAAFAPAAATRTSPTARASAEWRYGNAGAVAASAACSLEDCGAGVSVGDARPLVGFAHGVVFPLGARLRLEAMQLCTVACAPSGPGAVCRLGTSLQLHRAWTLRQVLGQGPVLLDASLFCDAGAEAQRLMRPKQRFGCAVEQSIFRLEVAVDASQGRPAFTIGFRRPSALAVEPDDRCFHYAIG